MRLLSDIPHLHESILMHSRRLILILVILIACVGCDQATKAVAKANLTDDQVVLLLNGSIRIQLAKNYGTFLSLGASLPEGVRNAATTVGVGLILTVLLIYAVLSKEDNPVVTSAIAMLIGGGLSNLLDRIAYGGYVVDFLNVGVGWLRTGVFNVADMFIMAGVFMLLFSEQIKRRLARNSENNPPPEGPQAS
jgi:signal peptidase II